MTGLLEPQDRSLYSLSPLDLALVFLLTHELPPLGLHQLAVEGGLADTQVDDVVHFTHPNAELMPAAYTGGLLPILVHMLVI